MFYDILDILIATSILWLLLKITNRIFEKITYKKPCCHSWVEEVGIFNRWGGGKYFAKCHKCDKTITKREDIHRDSGMWVDFK